MKHNLSLFVIFLFVLLAFFYALAMVSSHSGGSGSLGYSEPETSGVAARDEAPRLPKLRKPPPGGRIQAPLSEELPPIPVGAQGMQENSSVELADEREGTLRVLDSLTKRELTEVYVLSGNAVSSRKLVWTSQDLESAVSTRSPLSLSELGLTNPPNLPRVWIGSTGFIAKRFSYDLSEPRSHTIFLDRAASLQVDVSLDWIPASFEGEMGNKGTIFHGKLIGGAHSATLVLRDTGEFAARRYDSSIFAGSSSFHFVNLRPGIYEAAVILGEDLKTVVAEGSVEVVAGETGHITLRVTPSDIPDRYDVTLRVIAPGFHKAGESLGVTMLAPQDWVLGRGLSVAGQKSGPMSWDFEFPDLPMGMYKVDYSFADVWGTGLVRFHSQKLGATLELPELLTVSATVVDGDSGDPLWTDGITWSQSPIGPNAIQMNGGAYERGADHSYELRIPKGQTKMEILSEHEYLETSLIHVNDSGQNLVLQAAGLELLVVKLEDFISVTDYRLLNFLAKSLVIAGPGRVVEITPGLGVVHVAITEPGAYTLSLEPSLDLDSVEPIRINVMRSKTSYVTVPWLPILDEL